MTNKPYKILMLCGKDRSSNIMYNGLAPYFDIVHVIQEDRVSYTKILIRRVKKLGLFKVLGQLLFLFFNKILLKITKNRIRLLLADYGLNEKEIPEKIVRRVRSVNNNYTINLLRDINPNAVVVNGTRIISKKVLSCIDAPFINTHLGITLKYRGVHGGYWALANGDPDNYGVTVHLIDIGIDTGGVLYQNFIKVLKNDNFNTYPIHQIAHAIPLMKDTLKDIKENQLNTREGILPSKLWSHPTLFEYIMAWISKGVL
tara:strand:+ start:1760 stop:2533 length:774 start_codon:yes stop_codon:yes gene_type:complete